MAKATKNPTAKSFVKFIISYYKQLLDQFSSREFQSSTDLYDQGADQVDWIKEWARVALAYQNGREEYDQSLHRFYGGEMSCAGLLYGPMFGLISEQPTDAYLMAYDHALFDLGYAKDITALSAAMTSLMIQDYSVDTMLHTLALIDPHGYKDSRLIGRLSTATITESQRNVWDYLEKQIPESELSIPVEGYPGSSDLWTKQEEVYQFLEDHQRQIAFHAGEIWQILITALTFGEGDFPRTMEFIVNYGRDNDTVAAVAGFILGASVGYNGLPEDQRVTVLRVSREEIGIDLETMADEIVSNFSGRFVDSQ